MELLIPLAYLSKEVSLFCFQVHYPYKRDTQVMFSHIPNFFYSLFRNCLLILKVSVILLSFMMGSNSNFKDALLTKPNPNVELSASGSPLGNPPIDLTLQKDPPHPPTFPEAVVLDSLPQVQKDIVELSKSCLFGKMLSAPLDLRTIIASTKADWKIIKGEVDYMQLENGWILLRFANPRDLSLIWSE